jgi:hypothetical protein
LTQDSKLYQEIAEMTGPCQETGQIELDNKANMAEAEFKTAEVEGNLVSAVAAESFQSSGTLENSYPLLRVDKRGRLQRVP